MLSSQSSEDLGCADAAGAGYRARIPAGSGLVVERADALVEPVDLVGQGQREPGFGGDIGGQRVEVELAAVCRPQRGRGGFDDRVGAFVCPCLAAAAAKNAARRALPRRLTWTGLAYRAKNRSAVNAISEPSAAIHAGPRISRQRIKAGHARGAPISSPERILTARFSSSPGPSESSRCSPSGRKGEAGQALWSRADQSLVCLL